MAGIRVIRRLLGLQDVNASDIEDGETLVWDADNSEFIPGSGGGSGADDQTAAEVAFTPAGNIAASDVQAALEELDTEKAAASHVHAGEEVALGFHGHRCVSCLGVQAFAPKILHGRCT